MQLDWQPASPYEERLAQAFAAGDTVTCLRLLRNGQFALPMTEAAARGHEAPAWTTVPTEERTWLVAYTSSEAMMVGTRGAAEYCRVVSLVELAAGWPDTRWGLAINPLLPVHFFLESGTLARLAVSTLATDVANHPDEPLPILQKLLTPYDMERYLIARENWVSGYVHDASDVAHIATPAVLVDAVGLKAVEDELITQEGSVNLLRWRPVGASLYRTPFGGVDEERMKAVAGWVIEEPPFVGMGMAPNVDQLVREYKVDGVGLPHAAEIWELDDDGREHRRAVLDGDRGEWLIVRSEAVEDAEGADDEAGGAP